MTPPTRPLSSAMFGARSSTTRVDERAADSGVYRPAMTATEDMLARIAALEVIVQELQTELARRSTMHRTLRCRCGGTTILQFTRVDELGAHNLPVKGGLAYNARWAGPETVAPLEAYACFSCGLVEWHVSSFEGVHIDGKRVIRHEAPADRADPPGPYR